MGPETFKSIWKGALAPITLLHSLAGDSRMEGYKSAAFTALLKERRFIITDQTP
jgi:hypothetical protein